MRRTFIALAPFILFAACKKNAGIPNQTLAITTTYSQAYHAAIGYNSGGNHVVSVIDTSLLSGTVKKTVVLPAYYTVSIEVDYSDTAKTAPVVSIIDNSATAIDSTITDSNGKIHKVFETGGIDNN